MASEQHQDQGAGRGRSNAPVAPARKETALAIPVLGLVEPVTPQTSAPADWQAQRAEEQLTRISGEAERIEAAVLRDDAATDRDDDANERTGRAAGVAARQEAADPDNGPLLAALAANGVLRDRARRDRDSAADDRRHSATQREESAADRRQGPVVLAKTSALRSTGRG